MKKSDIWCIGILTYVLLCGRVPFNGSSHKEILMKIISSKNKPIIFPSKIKLKNYYVMIQIIDYQHMR